MSHPTRGVWIETLNGLKLKFPDLGHTPRGVCGLKQYNNRLLILRLMSHPTRGVWIETVKNSQGRLNEQRHTPRGVCGLKQSKIVKVG